MVEGLADTGGISHRGAETVQSTEEKALRDLTKCKKHEGECKENRASLCSVTERIRSNEYKLEQQRFKVNLSKHFFTVKATKHCPERLWSLLKSHLVVVLATQFQKALLEHMLDQMAFRGPFLSQPSCDCVIVNNFFLKST